MPKISEDRLAARRGEILEGARRAFAQHGYEGATVKVLEAETGLSRGAIFHHFGDKQSLFLALAEDDAARMAATVAEQGLVQVMRDLQAVHRAGGDVGWLGVQLEVHRKLRTDPEFAARWSEQQSAVHGATTRRLQRQRAAGAVRKDVPLPVLVEFLWLAYDGLVSALAADAPPAHLSAVLDLVEAAVRPPGTSVTADRSEGAPR